MKRVLVANRGEIAVRIAQACKDTGLTSIGVFSDTDHDALHVRRCDEAYRLEGSSLAETYLNIEQLIDLAVRVGADAVHPGYGFLSENSNFAAAVESNGLIWVGPPSAAIQALGDKVTAREIAIQADAPIVAGTTGSLQSADEVVEFVRQHGLPVAIKAAYGGGGRGMRVVWNADDVESAFDAATRESQVAFGRSECYVEKYLSRPRHIEVQLLADAHDNVVAIDTRDCTLQRRFQKLIEESPAPFLSPAIRAEAIAAAKRIARLVGYRGAATVEFLLSEQGELAFLEVNTRLQVEHSVTEEATGVDLVAEQLAVAQGLPLSMLDDVQATRHAIEFRITAEDPGRGFFPSPGTVERFEPASGPGVRTDTSLASGGIVHPEYDSLIAKIIVSGTTRTQALARARRALAETTIAGIPTVLRFHQHMLEEPDFIAEDDLHIHTRWIEEDMTRVFAPDPAISPEGTPARPLRHVTITIDGRAVELGLPDNIGLSSPTAIKTALVTESEAVDDSAVTAAMNGSVVKVLAIEGSSVQEGDILVVLESMKMETQITAPFGGQIGSVEIAEGDKVRGGQVLVRIER